LSREANSAQRLDESFIVLYIFDLGLDVDVQSQPGHPRQGTNEVAALYTWVDFPGNPQSQEWSPARRAIKALLVDMGRDGVEVEIFGPR